jgi:hypothetical protein
LDAGPKRVARAPSSSTRIVVGAFVWNVHAAERPLGTNNDVRSPTTTQNAKTSGIQNTIVRGWASADRSMPVLQSAARSVPDEFRRLAEREP